MLFRCGHPGHHHRAPSNDQGYAVRGRRRHAHFTVDIHCHMHVPEADAMIPDPEMKKLSNPFLACNALTIDINRKQMATLHNKLIDPVERIADMDEAGIDVQAVSPSPFYYNYWFDADLARQTSRVVNDRVAEVCAKHPDRFVGLCTVPLQDPRLALEELERCIGKLGMRGVEVNTHVNGKELTRAGLDRFWARVEELGVMVFMHPHGSTFTERLRDHYLLNSIGHPLESTIAVAHFVHDGFLEKHPDIKICIAHAGGYAPVYFGRYDHPSSRRDDAREHISKPPSYYIGKLYFDACTFSETHLRYMIDQWGADHVLLGTDYPYDMTQPDPVGLIDSVKGLTEADKAKVMGANAARLLNMLERVPH